MVGTSGKRFFADTPFTILSIWALRDLVALYPEFFLTSRDGLKRSGSRMGPSSFVVERSSQIVPQSLYGDA